MKRNVLGNYEIAPVFTWESGQWGTVQSGVDSNLNGDAAPDRAILNPGGISRTGSDVIGLVATSGPNAGNIVAYQAVNPERAVHHCADGGAGKLKPQYLHNGSH